MARRFGGLGFGFGFGFGFSLRPLFPFVAADLPDAQADTAAIRFDANDFHQDTFARRQFVALFHVAKLGIVQQPFDARFQLDEDAKIHHLGDFAFDQRAFLVFFGCDIPWVRREGFDAQGDALAVTVDAEDFDLDALAFVIGLARILDAAPGKFGDVNQTIQSTEVDEQTKVGDLADAPTPDLPGL